MEKNITLDFSKTLGNDKQELAVMPASLAQKLLKEYAQGLQSVSTMTIIEDQLTKLHELRNQNNLSGFIEAQIEFVQERQLIANILDGNWDAYKTK